MKDSNTNLSISQKTKVASSLENSISSLTPLGQNSSKFGNNTTLHNNSNNSDDEFELPLGNLIIDLDADIEKSNEKFSEENESHFINIKTNKSPNKQNSVLGLLEQNSKIMSAKSNRDINNVNSNLNTSQVSSHQSNSSNSGSSNKPALVQTVEKGLKMKIKRKSIGGKSSESKLEIVQSDTIPRPNSNYNTKAEKNGVNSNNSSSNNLSISNSSSNNNFNKEFNENEKSKHSSSKNKNISHKEKKDKKDRDKNVLNNSTHNKNELNGSFNSLSNSTNNDTKEQRNQNSVNLDKKVSSSQPQANNELSSNSALTSNLNNFTQNHVKKEIDSSSPPLKKTKTEEIKPTVNSLSVNSTTNKPKPEMRSVSTSTSVGTITEPECLGFCEPGSTVCLEGIVWQETDGVLVVNVTWRGKTYVGTLLDCTRHDWAPPRLCDSPTSDLENKGLKNTRGKRARSSISEMDSRLFQSKLRNGKGRRNNFTVPASPVKIDQNSNKRTTKNGTKDTENKLSTSTSRNTPTPTPIDNLPCLPSNSPAPRQPASPVFIECPEPNCSKKYKHINGLKYHQTHAHSGNILKVDELDENCKDSVATTDTEDNMDTESITNSPQAKSTNLEICSDSNDNKISENNSSEKQIDCDYDSKSATKNNILLSNNIYNQLESVQSPAYSDISDANETLNENDTDQDVKLDNEVLLASDKNKPIGFQKSNKDINFSNADLELESKVSSDSNNKLNDNKSKEDLKIIDNSSEKEFKIKPRPNSLDLNGLNTHQPLQQPAYPFNLMQNYPFPIDPEMHNYLLHTDNNYKTNFERHLFEQERLMKKEQKLDKDSNSNIQNLSNNPHRSESLYFPKESNEFMNAIDFKQQMSLKHSPSRMSPHNQISPQNTQQSHSSLVNQQLNKPNSPYDFMHYEKQREELLKISSSTSRNEERFMGKNQLGKVSSPKQSHLFNQGNKEENRNPSSKIKDDAIKPTMETTGPPPAPSNTYYRLPPSFLGPHNNVFPPNLQFDPAIFRGQSSIPFNNNSLPGNSSNFINNLRFPGSLGSQIPIRPNLSGHDLNNKLLNNLNSNGNKKTLDLFQQSNQQYSNKLKNIHEKQISSHNSSNKNIASSAMNLNNQRQSSNQLSNTINSIKKEEHSSTPPPTQHHLHPQHPQHHSGYPLIDPYGALIQHVATSGCVNPYSQK